MRRVYLSIGHFNMDEVSYLLKQMPGYWAPMIHVLDELHVNLVYLNEQTLNILNALDLHGKDIDNLIGEIENECARHDEAIGIIQLCGEVIQKEVSTFIEMKGTV